MSYSPNAILCAVVGGVVIGLVVLTMHVWWHSYP